MSASAADVRSPIFQRQSSFRPSSSNRNDTQRGSSQSLAAPPIQRTLSNAGSRSAVQNAQTTLLPKGHRSQSKLPFSRSSFNAWDTLKGCIPRPSRTTLPTHVDRQKPASTVLSAPARTESRAKITSQRILPPKGSINYNRKTTGRLICNSSGRCRMHDRPRPGLENIVSSRYFLT